jgi:serine/threonine protein kinase
VARLHREQQLALSAHSSGTELKLRVARGVTTVVRLEEDVKLIAVEREGLGDRVWVDVAAQSLLLEPLRSLAPGETLSLKVLLQQGETRTRLVLLLVSDSSEVDTQVNLELRPRSDRRPVEHPHVVRLLDSGYWRMSSKQVRLPFLVMEYVQGAHLYTWAAQSAVRVGDALELFRQSALALLAVHEADAFHRDIKGENFIIDRSGKRLVLVDFGVGDYLGSALLTRSRLPPGTDPYRSPEALLFQQENQSNFEEQYTFKSTDDVYALGVTWFRALTGKMPFPQQGLEVTQGRRRGNQKPRPPSTLNPRVPQAVSQLLLKMLSSRPEKRPTIAQLLRELEALTRSGGQELEVYLFERQRLPARSLPLRAAGFLWRWWRSRPWLALVSGVLLLALSGLMLQLVAPSPSIHPTQENHSMPSLVTSLLQKASLSACLLTAAGCASVPRNGPPARPQHCPEEALAAMKSIGLKPGSKAFATFDINQPGFMSDFGVYQEGPIVSAVTELDTPNTLPVGAKLYGYVWEMEKDVHLHWDRIELPDGRQLPFCAVLGHNEDGGSWKDPGPMPGTFTTSKKAPITVTDRFIQVK